MLCASFYVIEIKTGVISLREIEGSNARDQIAFSAFHAFLAEVQTKLVTYVPYVCNSNLEIRSVSSSCRLHAINTGRWVSLTNLVSDRCGYTSPFPQSTELGSPWFFLVAFTLAVTQR